jgi:Ni,Fe-hydrogenase III component G
MTDSSTPDGVPAYNGVPAGLHRIVLTVEPAQLSDQAEALFEDGFRLSLVAAHDDGETLRVVYLFLAGLPDRRIELEVTLPIDNPALPSLASMSFPASRFEREMHDLYGIEPVNHPLPRRLVRHAHWPAGWYPMRRDAGAPPPFTDSEAYPFIAVVGDGVYEIPVGPVHAGIIEPGHFRFSVVGESILKLKARLWFTHRGVERLFEGLPATEALHLAERISGDTSAGHALAHSLAVEDALGITMPEPAHRLRALVIELERLYNHCADVGALANDVGFSLANAHALRIREELLRINSATTGHRLLRGAISPGRAELLSLPDPGQLARLAEDLAEVAELTLDNTVIRDRFTGTAALTLEQLSRVSSATSAAWAMSPGPAAWPPMPASSTPPASCRSPRSPRPAAMSWPGSPCALASMRLPHSLPPTSSPLRTRSASAPYLQRGRPRASLWTA